MTQLAPGNPYAERQEQSYETRWAPAIPRNRGPLRHEEGMASDTDLPSGFATGAYADTTFGTRLNHNVETTRKWPEETMRERAHVGSAAWEEAPERLGDFVQGAGVGQTPPTWERITNPLNVRQYRRSATVITD